MALHWEWKEKVGYAILEGLDSNFRLSLYEGNAFLIMLHEQDCKWNMYSFWADKDHMKNCLGLYKGDNENIYDRDGNRIVKFCFYKNKSKHYKDIVAAVIKAFDNIDIEIQTI